MTSEKNDINNFSLILNSTWPLRLSHENCIDIIYKNNNNNNSSLIMKDTWSSKLGLKSSMDIICKNNIIDNFFLLSRPKGKKCKKR